MGNARESERGYLLIAVLFLMALLLFALATAAPKVSSDLRRDREQETIHRGMQYARAIQLYYRKFGHYPVSVDELVNSNHIRFLRKKYVDPMTGKDTWRLIHVGESKTMLVGGVPGQVGVPAGQAGLSGTTPSGGIGGASPAGTFGGASPIGGIGGTNPIGGLSGASPIGGLQGGGAGYSNGPGLQGGQTSGGIVVGSSPTGQQSTDPNAPTPPGTSDSEPGSTVGGGPIVGVSSTNPKESIRVLKKMTHYNQWEFIYDPTLDAGGVGGANGLQGTQTGGTTNPLGSNTPSPTTQPTPAPSTPNPTPQPTPPQQ